MNISKRDQTLPQIALVVHGLDGGNAEVEDKKGHGHGKDTIAESGKAFHTLAGNPVIKCRHGNGVYQA